MVSGGTIAVSESQTLMVEGLKPGWTASDLVTATYVLNGGALSTPTFLPGAGTYPSARDVAISTTSMGATIRYTTDGTDPTLTSPLYSTPVKVDWTTTLKARAFKAESTPSGVGTAAYTVTLANTVAPPTLNPPPGTYAAKQTVRLSSTTAGSTVYYTLDGSTPVAGTSASVPTGGTVVLSSSAILRAFAAKAGMSDSPLRRGDYQVTGAVQAGLSHALVLKTDGTVWGWGINGSGQLGTGDTATATVPTQAIGITDAVAIATETDGLGAGTSLALLGNGTLVGSGKNNWGQTGIGSATSASVVTPTAVPGLSGVVAISVGYSHGLALKSDSTVWAFGYNLYGQCGNNTSGSTPVLIPVQVKTGAVHVPDRRGGRRRRRLFLDGAAAGRNRRGLGEQRDGQIGDGTPTNRLVATPVVGLSGVTAIAAGWGHALAVKTDGETRGSVWGWGDNTGFLLGASDLSLSRTPILITSEGDRARGRDRRFALRSQRAGHRERDLGDGVHGRLGPRFRRRPEREPRRDQAGHGGLRGHGRGRFGEAGLEARHERVRVGERHGPLRGRLRPGDGRGRRPGPRQRRADDGPGMGARNRPLEPRHERRRDPGRDRRPERHQPDEPGHGRGRRRQQDRDPERDGSLPVGHGRGRRERRRGLLPARSDEVHVPAPGPERPHAAHDHADGAHERRPHQLGSLSEVYP